ncbi:MAG TPA: GxxExxY protein [Phycisphaerales bacterium]|nr:GxxExxY protein [Phycisphaerales bacterium]
MADALTEKIIGAAIEVHRELGPGLLEAIYEEALCFEFDLQGIPYDRQVPVDLIYKGHPISGHKLDLLVAQEVVVEIKAQKTPVGVVVSQTITYLKATGLKRGLIINFAHDRLTDGVKRVSL